jgi:hypothetical protein
MPFRFHHWLIIKFNEFSDMWACKHKFHALANDIFQSTYWFNFLGTAFFFINYSTFFFIFLSFVCLSPQFTDLSIEYFSLYHVIWLCAHYNTERKVRYRDTKSVLFIHITILLSIWLIIELHFSDITNTLL